LGFNIGKKIGSAVDRNRVRRRLRHIVRQLGPSPGYDLVLIANPRTGSAPYSQLKSQARDLLIGAGIPLTGAEARS
jgi:ribonuclease P protein component